MENEGGEGRVCEEAAGEESEGFIFVEVGSLKCVRSVRRVFKVITDDVLLAAEVDEKMAPF